MFSHSIRPRFAIGVAVLLMGAAAVVVVVVGAATHAEASAATVAPSPMALSHYSIFRRGAVATDAIPAVNLLALEPSGGALTRRQSTGGSAYSQWVTLEGDKLCVVVRSTPADSPDGAPNTDRACNSAAYLEQHDQLLVQASLVNSTSSIPPSPGLANVISGLAPDGVPAVTLSFTDGTKQTVPVEENGFSYSLGSSAKTLASVTWTGASGQTSTDKN